MKPSSLPPFISRQTVSGRYFFLNLNPGETKGLTVICGGREVCPKGYEVNRASFPYFCVEYVQSGQGVVTLNGGKHPLRAGAVFCYDAQTSHHIQALGPGVMVKYFIAFTGPQATELLKQTGLRDAPVMHLSELHWLTSNFDELLELNVDITELAHRHSGKLLELILLRIETHSHVGARNESASYATFMRCQRYIEDQFAQLHSIQEVAHDCKIDVAYLCRLFQRYASQSPHRYLIQAKMDRAAMLLMRREANVKEAGHIVGYADPYHFSRVFKRVHGLSPSNFVAQLDNRGVMS